MVVSAVVAGLLTAAGAVALAAIPDTGTGVFHGCYSTSTGALRVVDPSANQACRASEKAITWNQSGISWRGAWDPDTSYAVNDAVAYDGSSYVAIAPNTRRPPTRSPSTWDTLAAQGTPGQAGTNGTTILNGPSRPPAISAGLTNGDFYLDTTTDVLWGPVVITCQKLQCSTNWGNGTKLAGTQGAPGPTGNGMSYETKFGSIAEPTGFFSPVVVNVPSGASTRILTQTIPAGGDYQVTATLTLGHGGGSQSFWECGLVAANPGGPTVTLDVAAIKSTTEFVNMTLVGDVSLASGGFVAVNCSEVEALRDDEVNLAHIISTQISGFTEIPPG